MSEYDNHALDSNICSIVKPDLNGCFLRKISMDQSTACLYILQISEYETLFGLDNAKGLLEYNRLEHDLLDFHRRRHGKGTVPPRSQSDDEIGPPSAFLDHESL